MLQTFRIAPPPIDCVLDDRTGGRGLTGTSLPPICKELAHVPEI